MSQIRYQKEIRLPPASESLESNFYNCKYGCELIFKLHPLLIARQIHFSTNYPVNSDSTTFSREKYYDVPWMSTQKTFKEFDPDRSISINVDKPGTFCFLYTWISVEGISIEKKGYFIVEPKTNIPINSITLQTYIVRCLGTLEDWKPRLCLSKYCNYNAIHLTPVQERGNSDSAYSIKDHLKLHPNIISPEVQAKLSGSANIKIDNTICSDFSYEIDKGHMVLEEALRNVSSEWGLMRVTDLVWNHCSYDCVWLRDHPDAGYNLCNSLHLIPAYVVDRELANLSKEIGIASHEDTYGVTRVVSKDDAQGYKNSLEKLLTKLLPERTKLEEYLQVDVDKVYTSVYDKLQTTEYSKIGESKDKLYPINKTFVRHAAWIDEDLALQIFFGGLDNSSSAGKIESCLANFKKSLLQMNAESQHSMENYLNDSITASMNRFDWRFLDKSGPSLTYISEDTPITPEYFFHLDGHIWLTDEQIEDKEQAKKVLIHNGYVIDWNPVLNIAGPESNVYLRRDVEVWGDSCKLNYGDKPADNPWLWEYMRHYTILMARMFDGFRIDNCHNTPIHVAEYYLDEARLVNPNLLVIAELFTNSLEKDSLFINRMGLNLLIREAIHTYRPYDLCSHIYKFGGELFIGSMLQQITLPSKGDTPLAIFYDVTHDNENIIEKHTVFDVVPTTAIISMSTCPTGSCRGYDELIPHHIHIVREKRLYSNYKEDEFSFGIFKIKRELNRLHSSMVSEGYTEMYIDSLTDTVLSVTRHNPNTLDSYILITHTCFSEPEAQYKPTKQDKHKQFPIPSLTLEGQVADIVLEAFIKQDTSISYEKDKDNINGLSGYIPFIQSNINQNRSKLVKVIAKLGDPQVKIEFVDFPPGAVIIMSIKPRQEAISAANGLRGLAAFQQLNRVARAQYVEGMNARNTFDSELSKLSLLDFNFLLYHSEAEEMELGGDLYEIPGYGKTVYAGLQGVVSILDNIRRTNELGHPLCNNIRDGNWMLEFIAKRLKRRSSLAAISKILLNSCIQLDKIPRSLKPSYFDLIISSLYGMIISHCLKLFSPFVQEGNSLVRNLALCSVQLVSDCKSAPLPIHNTKNASEIPTGSLAAGLPHFTTGNMRCWGRDTFISLRGILIVTGRVAEARQHILSYASTIRHGMIPNLLGAGERSRYNCRDAPWWFIESIRYLTKYTGDNDILKEKITRVFVDDDSEAFGETKEETLIEIIQEILSRHCDGIHFKERNAGVELDRDMTDEGFHIEAYVDLNTGFVCGGSEYNCGTWMDKMGSSEQAGNKGKPATPRDGSAIELVALCRSVVSWLSYLYAEGIYPYEGVEVRAGLSGERVTMSFKVWAEKIRNNFEDKFWIPQDKEEAKKKEGENKDYIHKTGIYKDTLGASQKWTDYQLRPNFPIAMVVAPDLFDSDNARLAIEQANESLLGPLGMRTLDREDWAYRGNYLMNDSDDYNTAFGFNYHQGPEWLWLTGFYLQAVLTFCSREDIVSSVYEVLSRVYDCLLNSEWKGLPELTNENGINCESSCPTQAWSIATFLDTLYAIHCNKGGML
ncbi:hypothetical protein LOD99_8967 [Oopsacas minuta]|uniref:4-alpha-glucanotransferase n=1 Tax=Oopsacas minuta TaxID=111878 RepID=A0AAV7JE26_9METZ|nr:hypothetical protein LOD99_8967 [Oopsacas minuta]